MASPPETQIMLSLAMTFSPDNHDAFLDALRPVWAACAAEPECLLFDVFASPGQKGRFRIVEVWKGNREWFEQVRELLAFSFFLLNRSILRREKWKKGVKEKKQRPGGWVPLLFPLGEK